MKNFKRIYDQKNRLIEEKSTDHYISKKYDENDNLISEEEKFRSTNNIKESIYDEKNRLIVYKSDNLLREITYDDRFEDKIISNKLINLKIYNTIVEKEFFKYNEKGLLIEHDFEDVYKKYKVIYTYNKNDLVEKIEKEYEPTFTNVGSTKINTFKYDEKNRVILENEIYKYKDSLNSFENKSIEYEYDDIKNIQKETIKESSNISNEKVDIRLIGFDEKNRKILEMYNNEIIEEHKYWNLETDILKYEKFGLNEKFYNEKGLIVKDLTDYPHGNYYNVDIYEYDNNDNLIRKENSYIKYLDTPIINSVVEFEYDLNNNLTKQRYNNQDIVSYENEYIINEQELKQELDDYFDFDK